MKIINWNISWLHSIDNKVSYLKKIAGNSFIIILQEVKQNAYEAIKEEFGLTANVEYSLDYRKPSRFDNESRKLGILIMVSKDIKVLKCEVLERTLMPDRTLIVDLEYNNTFIRALGLHSITGCQHGKAKAIQYYSFAEAIDTYKPDIVGIDANEPEMDHYEIEKMKFFDNYDKGMGCKTFFEIMNENSLADSFIKNYKKEGFIEGECLTTSYVKRGRKRVRYDFLFINSKKFEEYNYIYNYNDAVEAGSDHAAVIVDVKI